MIEDYLTLRNKIHQDSFRFNLPAKLWAAHYLLDPNMEASRVVRVEKNGVLEGYAVYEPMVERNIRAYRLLEICATSKEVQGQLVDQIINRGVEDKIDFVFTRKCEELLDVVFDEKKFVSFVDCVIMCALLDPHELLLSISDNVDDGEVLELNIKGFNPIFVRVGRGKIRVLKQEKPDVKVKIDSKTFLKLFFGKTSFLKEFLKGKIIIDSVFRVLTVARFIGAIKQERAYIPLGDWT